MPTSCDPHRCQCTTDGRCACARNSKSTPIEYAPLPGLYRRSEFARVIDEGCEFRVERHGADADGTALFAVYRRPTAE
jgi:hypothetical protein